MLTTRRQAMKTLAAATLGATALGKISALAQTAPAATTATPEPAGPFTLPPLPYAYDALEPNIDTETMHLHHDKHHAAYVKKLNEALAKEPSFSPGNDIEELLKNFASVPEAIQTDVRNQGGGHANHSLFWQTLSPKGGGTPGEALGKAITNDLGGFDKFKEEVAKAGAGLFGSGWVWLVLDGGKNLTILTLPNQDSPLIEGHYPLFGIDVWEHAYYLKYHNLRPDYIKAIWNVVNWDFISARYDKAMKA
ncbi:MAG TPA: superoxide dismutase [Candidatus Methylacidiphilales bacterium]|nr:superoxide dismutase [Candidatus Methylacidiphilales bacterium]